MSAAILDHRRNPTGISSRDGTTGPGAGRKYRDCNLDDSYEELFRASYACRLKSCLYRRPHNRTKPLRRGEKQFRGR